MKRLLLLVSDHFALVNQMEIEKSHQQLSITSAFSLMVGSNPLPGIGGGGGGGGGTIP